MFKVKIKYLFYEAEVIIFVKKQQYVQTFQ